MYNAIIDQVFWIKIVQYFQFLITFFCVTGSSPVMADKKKGQCAFGQDAQAQKYRVNLSCGKSCSESTSIGKKGRNIFYNHLLLIKSFQRYKFDYFYDLKQFQFGTINQRSSNLFLYFSKFTSPSTWFLLPSLCKVFIFEKNHPKQLHI